MIRKEVLFFFICIYLTLANANIGRVKYTFSEFASNPCIKPGRMCLSCEELVDCEQMPDGSLVPRPAGICGLGETCMKSTANCTVDYNAECHPSIAKFKFKCQQIGIFPDPFDCTKFHICTGVSDTESIIRSCPEDHSFDPLTMLCSTKMATKCPLPVMPCKANETVGVVNNPRLFYMCIEENTDEGIMYFPHFYYCYSNYKFIHGKCSDPAQPQGLTDGKCPGPGSFYRPNCRQYNKCGAVGTAPVVTNCQLNYHFNSQTSLCVPSPDVCVAMGIP